MSDAFHESDQRLHGDPGDGSRDAVLHLLMRLTPPNWPLPSSANDWRVAADYWEQQGDAETARLCRQRL